MVNKNNNRASDLGNKFMGIGNNHIINKASLSSSNWNTNKNNHNP
jgi:hypothetical protein